MNFTFVFILIIFFEIIVGRNYCPNYRTIDGQCNNIENINWGAANELFLEGPEGFDNSVPDFSIDNENPRTISNTIGDDIEGGQPQTSNLRCLSQTAIYFAQFVLHDAEALIRDTGEVEIPISFDDELARFSRTEEPFLSATVSKLFEVDGQKRVKNKNTAYLDLSVVYGNSLSISMKLRSFFGGKLASKDYPGSIYNFPTLLGVPFSTTFDLFNYPISITEADLNADFGDADEDSLNFATGDSRANDAMGTLMHHILWFRHHNKLADTLSTLNPEWDDETIYQEARRLNIAYYQHIVYDELVPALFDNKVPNYLKNYRRYDEDVNSGVSNIFLTTFALGHDMLDAFTLRSENFDVMYDGFPELGLPNQPFFLGQGRGRGNSGANLMAYTKGTAGLFRTLSVKRAAKLDAIIVDELRNIPNFGRGTGNTSGFDLLSIDTFRTRQNRLPGYHEARIQWFRPGRPRKGNLYKRPGCAKGRRGNPDSLKCFKYILDDNDRAIVWRDFFGSIEKIPLVVGLWAEKKEVDETLAPTLRNIIADQFSRFRDGDRFYYENDLSEPEIQQIKASSYSSILKSTLEGSGETLGNVADNLFYLPTPFQNSKINCEVEF